MESLAVMRSPYHPLTLFAFTGRIGRLQYLVGCLYLSAIALIVGFAGGVFVRLVGGGRTVEAVVMLAVLVPTLGMNVQRMRDFRLKWWWLLVIFGGFFASLFVSSVVVNNLVLMVSPIPPWIAPWVSAFQVVMFIIGLSLFAGMIGLSFALVFVPSKPEVMQDGERVELTFADKLIFQPRVGSSSET